jgi:hypothetical protein
LGAAALAGFEGLRVVSDIESFRATSPAAADVSDVEFPAGLQPPSNVPAVTRAMANVSRPVPVDLERMMISASA